MEIGQRTNQRGSATAQRILDHARQAFNERGLAAVGIRDIARELGLSPGNVSYHFATKEALVIALVEQMHAANNSTVAVAQALDFPRLDAMFRAVMRRDLEHRWLMRDAAGVIAGSPVLQDFQLKTRAARVARVDAIVEGLVAGGLLDPEQSARVLPLLREQVLTQVFFWIPAATLAAPERDPEERLDLHARAVLALFLVCCTAAGREQLEALL